jgi:hypothetical protein
VKRVLALAVVAGIVAGAVRMISMQKKQWQGLSESEARAKIDAKLPAKIPVEKRAEVTDKIVGAMKEKGVLAGPDQPAESVG